MILIKPAIKLFVLLFLALHMAACAPIQPKPNANSAMPFDPRMHLAGISAIKDFNIQGRLGVQHNQTGLSGSVHWHHLKKTDQLTFISPLGNKIAEISNGIQGATLITNENKVFNAPDPESLTEKTLGWKFPINKLSDWIIGRPSNGAITEMGWDELGRLTKFKQDGWQINYLSYQSVGQWSLPAKMSIHKDQLNLKLLIDQWQLPTY